MRTFPASLVALLAALLAPAGAAPALDGRLVDLTHPLDAETIFWPTETEGFVLEPVFAGETPHGWYAANRFRTAEHGGTHLDAPFHFAREGVGADQVPLERLVGPARIVDVSAAAAANPDHAVSAAEIAAHEAEHGTIAAGTIVLLRTGWSARWPDRARYLGTARAGPEAVAELHFPGLGEDGARHLAERGVAAVGIDTASIDPGPSQDFAAHRVLAAAQIPIFENVARLDAVPEAGATVVALPAKIRGGSGAPLRIIAIVPEGHQ